MNTQELNTHCFADMQKKTRAQIAQELSEALKLSQEKLEEKSDFFLDKLMLFVIGGLIVEAQQIAASDAVDYFQHTIEQKQAIKMHLSQKISAISGLPAEQLCKKPMFILIEMHKFLELGNIEQILSLAEQTFDYYPTGR